jgi:hypothetical protein
MQSRRRKHDSDLSDAERSDLARRLIEGINRVAQEPGLIGAILLRQSNKIIHVRQAGATSIRLASLCRLPRSCGVPAVDYARLAT